MNLEIYITKQGVSLILLIEYLNQTNILFLNKVISSNNIVAYYMLQGLLLYAAGITNFVTQIL